MKTFATLLSVFLSLSVLAQEENSFKVKYEGNRPYLVEQSSKTSIVLPPNRCYENIDPDAYTIEMTKNFVIVHIHDEMENNRGVLLFDKALRQINYDKVTEARKKYYKYSSCCVYVSEYKGELIFWDTTFDNEDYDCSTDSQSDGYSNIPRYYVFSPKDMRVETKVLTKPCDQLFREGKIACR